MVAVTGVVLFERKHALFRSGEPAAVSQATPADPASPMGKDGQFLWSLTNKGLQIARSNDAAINDARRVRTRFVGGESEQQIIQDILEGSPGISIDTATTFADVAIDVYCPKGYLDNS